MYTVLIDTHSDSVNIILYKEEKIVTKTEVVAEKSHSITTIPYLIDTLKNAGIEVTELNEILVINGPGSFTGVRIGVTIAKTLAYTLNIPIKTMSSLLIKAVSFSHETVRIVEREKNGVFLGTFDKNNQLVNEYTYENNSQYEPNPMDVENVTIDYEKVIKFAKNLESTNPHAVKPLYVKIIEVQK